MYSPKPEALFSADDWGLSPAVNEAILELAERGLLHSVSLFANLPYLEHGLPRLKATGVGLAAHLNFTLGRPLSAEVPALTAKGGAFHSFAAFVARGALGLLPAAQLRREASAQLSKLSSLCEISSLNGHQHAHLLPWMAAPLADAAREAGVRRVRLMCDHSHAASRLASLWSRRAYGRHWPGAVAEETHYLFPTGGWTRERLARKLVAAAGRPLLVHPALRDDFAGLEFSDRLRAARVREFESLREVGP